MDININAALYVEVNLVCIFILLVVLFRVQKSADNRRERRLFSTVTRCFCLMFGCDCAWRLIEGDPTPSIYILNYLFNYGYFIFNTIGVFCWFLYSERVQGSWAARNVKNSLICFIPLLVLIIVIITTNCTGAIFYIDENNIYHRGPFHIFQVLISFFYLLITSVKALILAFRKENYNRRYEFLSLASFAIVPTLFTALQTVVGEIMPIECVGYTVTILIIYMEVQGRRITLDYLTKINNREYILDYLITKMRSRRRDKELYLMMIDADDFKSINDKFGHAEGDAALIKIAETLTHTVPHDYCVARYGGDEFAIVAEAADEAEICETCSAIEDALGRISEEENLPYRLAVSIGYSSRKDNADTILDFIKAADEKLYKTKKEHYRRQNK